MPYTHESPDAGRDPMDGAPEDFDGPSGGPAPEDEGYGAEPSPDPACPTAPVAGAPDWIDWEDEMQNEEPQEQNDAEDQSPGPYPVPEQFDVKASEIPDACPCGEEIRYDTFDLQGHLLCLGGEDDTQASRSGRVSRAMSGVVVALCGDCDDILTS